MRSLHERLHPETGGDKGDDDRRLAACAGLMAGYAAAVITATARTGRRGRPAPVATARTAGRLFAPRATRLATATPAALAVADVLHCARVAAQQAPESRS